MRKRALLAFLICSAGLAWAQQRPQFTQYAQSRYILNPAATGVDEYMTISLGARKQWMGFGQEPTTYYLGAHQGFRATKDPEREPLALRTSRPDAYHFEQKEGEKSKLKHGLGGYLMGDRSGAIQSSLVNVSYALHLQATDKITVAFGANTGFYNTKFDASSAVPEEVNDQKYQSFITERSSLSMIDFNMGTYVYSDQFFFGYATNQLLGDRLTFGNTTNRVLVLHHTMMAGYTFKAGEDLSFTPSFITKGVKGAPISMDLNLRADMQNKYFGGIGFRNQDAISLMVGGYVKEQLSLSYSYDVNTSVVRGYSSGGHEIVLAYMLKK